MRVPYESVPLCDYHLGLVGNQNVPSLFPRIRARLSWSHILLGAHTQTYPRKLSSTHFLDFIVIGLRFLGSKSSDKTSQSYCKGKPNLNRKVTSKCVVTQVLGNAFDRHTLRECKTFTCNPICRESSPAMACQMMKLYFALIKVYPSEMPFTMMMTMMMRRRR